MAHLLMLHGHPVGYLPPTMATEIMYDENDNVKEKIDDIGKDILDNASRYSLYSMARLVGNVIIVKVYLYEYVANANIIKINSAYAPSQAKSIGYEWLLTDSVNWGSKQFFIDTNGNITCSTDIYRGGITLMFSI